MCLLLHYSSSCLVARRVDSRYKSPTESADEPFFEGRNLAGGTIGTENDLFAVVVQGVKSVEKFFLALLALAEKLHIIDDKRIDSPELALKALLNSPARWR